MLNTQFPTPAFTEAETAEPSSTVVPEANMRPCTPSTLVLEIRSSMMLTMPPIAEPP